MWHLLFLACFPVALVLAASGQWVPAAVVFFFGVPLAWNLRNRSAATSPMPRAASALKSLPTRYAIPAEVDRKLSSSRLDDLPTSLRERSPHDWADDEVRTWLAKVGSMPPQANFGVVYRVCFAPFMDEGEEPIRMTFGWIWISIRNSPPSIDEAEAAWLVLTPQALHWHRVEERVPGMPARTQLEELLTNVHEVYFTSRPKIAAGRLQSGPGGITVRLMTVQYVSPGSDVSWTHMIAVPAAEAGVFVDDTERLARSLGNPEP